MSNVTKIIIGMNGGIITGIESNNPIEVVVIDWTDIFEGEEFPEGPNITYGHFDDLKIRLEELKSENL